MIPSFSPLFPAQPNNAALALVISKMNSLTGRFDQVITNDMAQ